MTQLYIHWNPNPELFSIGGISIRYYGLLWVIGIALGYLVVRQQYRDKRLGDEKFEPLFFYCFLGILIGARLGHCIFYDWGYYKDHFLEMILPFKILPTGEWKFTGYAGLASHGGTLGLMISLWLYSRKYKIHYLDIVDMIAVATPICACCIRLANLMNSEIIGRPTDVPWAFVFERVDELPRHPGQLYEALAYLLFFIGMIVLYRIGLKKRREAENAHKGKIGSELPLAYPYHRGFFFGLCLAEIFIFRFFIEFLKENQVGFEEGMTFNMGQWLSVPFVIIGIYFMFFYNRANSNK